MPIPEDKQQIAITVPKTLLTVIDHVAKETGLTRSEVICNHIEGDIETLGLYALVGLTPGRVVKAMSSLRSNNILCRLLSLDEDSLNAQRKKVWERAAKRLGVMEDLLKDDERKKS